MFQSFEDFTDPTKGAERVGRLRTELKRRKLAAFLVPRTDEYQNEYVPPVGERLYWLTGFSGSAGLAIIQKKQAALFVDGRYTLQAGTQVDGGVFEVLQMPNVRPSEWLAEHSKKGRQDRLRPPPAHHGGDRTPGTGAGTGRRQIGPAKDQPDRRDLAGPARSAHGARHATRPGVFGEACGGKNCRSQAGPKGSQAETRPF